MNHRTLSGVVSGGVFYCRRAQATEFYYTNPLNQGLRYDTKGEYVHHWLPELAHIPGPAVHAPWAAAEKIPESYPEPVAVYDKWKRSMTTIGKVAAGEPMPKRRGRKRKTSSKKK